MIILRKYDRDKNPKARRCVASGKAHTGQAGGNPARQEANSGRKANAKCVNVSEEPYEGNPHVRFCEGGEQVV